MNPVTEFFKKLFDSSDWPARWHCGRWTDFHGWLYIISDLLVWSAYFSIPLVIIRYISKKQNIRFVRLYFLFAAFIMACGTTHFIDAVSFWVPAYRLNALVRLITGILSWTTVFYLVKFLPVAFSLKSQKELESEIEQRISAEKQSRESERQMQTILNAAPDAVIIINDDGKIIKWNLKAELMFGWTETEVMNQPLTETIIPHRYRDAHTKGLRHFLQTGEGVVLNNTIEITALKKDNTEFDVALSISSAIVNGKYLFTGFVRDITEKKRAEEKIRRLNAELEQRVAQRTEELYKSEKKYRYLFENNPMPMWIIDLPTFHFLDVNEAALAHYGYNREEFLSMTAIDIRPEEEKTRFRRANHPVNINTAEYNRGNWKHVKKDGTIIHVEIIAHDIVYEGKTSRFILSNDITERVKAEEELQRSVKALNESQQLLSAIVDNSSAVIYVKNLQGQYLMINRRFTELFHLSQEKVLGNTDYDFFSKDMADAFREIDVRAAESDYALTEQEVAPHDDGLHTYISVKSALRHENGKAYATFGISTDITQLKIVEETLRKSLREISDYKFALDESSIVAITDQKGIIKHANDNFCTISKYSRSELIGQDHRIINSGYHSKEFIRNLWVTIANGKIWRGELKNRAKDGTIYWVDTTIIPFLNEEGKPYQYVAIRSDITGRKKIEDELQQLNEALEEKVNTRTEQLLLANKELETFSYSVSHDLRAPLRIINGFGQILLEDYAEKLDEQGERIIQRIMNSTRKMGLLIDNLLDFSRLGRSEMRLSDVDMNELVKEVLDELKNGDTPVPSKLTVSHLKTAKGDGHLLKQVWINLISNAVKYSGKKEDPVIEIGTIKKENKDVYYIKDNGVGFDMKYKDKLFGVFQRLHYETEFTGTGVGLALVQRIITRHGGKVWAEAKENEGATFYFILPE